MLSIVEEQVCFEQNDELIYDGELYSARFQNYDLYSVFQPIYTFAHSEPVGYEALLRISSKEGELISPLEFFKKITNTEDLMQLEWLTLTLHVHNYFHLNNNNALLFLNINPLLVTKENRIDKKLPELFNFYDIPMSRIVIEIVEEHVEDLDHLIFMAQCLSACGCVIAIDDFGAGDSNFRRIWDLKPGLVKLDKAILSRLREEPELVRPVASLVELLHESKALVLLEGIEYPDDVKLASQLDVDLHQGYYFGKPQKKLLAVGLNQNPCFNAIANNTKQDEYFASIPEYIEHLFLSAANIIQNRESLAEYEYTLQDICKPLLNNPFVFRCYLIDIDGSQIEEMYGQHAVVSSSSQFGLSFYDKKANWSRRVYFKKALSKKGVLHKSRPYLSLTGMHHCITFSIGLITPSREILIFCSDINLENLNMQS